MRNQVKRMLAERFGLSVQRLKNVPFGVDWVEDAAYYLQGRPRCIFDVGANEGQTALRLLRRFPSAEIHSFEPIPETFALLQQRLAQTEVRAIECAVSDQVGRATLLSRDCIRTQWIPYRG